MATLENQSGGLDEENRNGLAAKALAQQRPAQSPAPVGCVEPADQQGPVGFAANALSAGKHFIHNHPGL